MSFPFLPLDASPSIVTDPVLPPFLRRYRKAWAGCLSLGAVWLAASIVQRIQYGWSNKKKAEKWARLTPEEQEHYIATTTTTNARRLDFQYTL